MAVLRWDPWGELAALQRDLGQLMTRATGEGTATRSLVPPMDAYSTEEGMVVRIDLPGMRPDQVDVSVQDGMLTIRGERKRDESVPDDAWLRRERPVGTFERSFSLPEGTDPDRISADYQNGMLELRIPHPKERQPRRIQIGGGEQAAGGQTVDVREAQQQ